MEYELSALELLMETFEDNGKNLQVLFKLFEWVSHKHSRTISLNITLLNFIYVYVNTMH